MTRISLAIVFTFALLQPSVVRSQESTAVEPGRPDLERDYRVWGYPFVPVIFALSSFAIVASHVFLNPVEAGVGLSLVVVGFPVYYFWTHVSRKERTS